MSSSLLHEYNRARAFRKAMLYVFFTVFVITVLWAVPWLPYGLSVQDYNRRTELLVAFSLMASISGLASASTLRKRSAITANLPPPAFARWHSMTTRS